MITNDVVMTMKNKIVQEEGLDENDRRVAHEVMQQIALAGLFRGGFFDAASFYGGTCLRMFHGLKRFSEDMDFSLDVPDKNFEIEKYFGHIVNEFESMGIDVSIKKKQKTGATHVESAFLKSDTKIYDIGIAAKSKISIKVEVDTDPPPGFETEARLMALPFSFYTKCYKLPDLYAGKMHALIYRNWKNRVKGRDWYDFEWYVRNNVTLNLDHLVSRINQSGGKFESGISETEFIEILTDKIRSTDIEQAKTDIEKFVYDPDELNIWSTQYFLDLVPLIRFKK